MKFMPYQWKWINDKSRLKILEKSRRIGGTYSTSYEVFQKLMSQKGKDVIFISRDNATAVEFVRYVTHWCKAYNIIAKPSERIPEQCILKESIEIPHNNGNNPSRLIIASSNPDSAAGKGGSLYLDELALHKDPELLMTIAKPIITAGGSLTVLSTHRSKHSIFNRLVQEALKDGSEWSHHKVTMDDAVSQGFVDQVVNPGLIENGEDHWKNGEEFLHDLRYNIIANEADWDQEFCCIPSEKQTTLISLALCEAAVGNPSYDPKKTCYLGWDIATSPAGDFTCIVIIQRGDNNDIKLIHYEVDKGINLEDQRERIKDLVKQYKVSKMCLDATGIGIDSAQILERFYGENVCNPVVFGLKTKAEMAGQMLSVFQSRNMVIPDDKSLEVDINSVEKIYSNAGNVTYNAPKVAGSHGDRFWGLALALRACGWQRDSFITGLEIQKPSRNFGWDDDDDDDDYEDLAINTIEDYI